MTQEQKDLLLNDLCSRLPYGVKVQIKNEIVVLDSICDDDGYHFNFIGDDREGVNIENIKPYLFPMSSMTGDEVLEYISLKESIIASDDITYYFETYESIDWLIKNHFDYRGLIPKGLANDATGKNIY